MKRARAEAEVSVDFPSKSDAEAMVRALIPETATRRTRRASVRVTRQGRVTKMRFYARDLIALRATVNSFLRFAVTWKRLSKTLSSSRRAGAARQIHGPERR